MCFLQKGQRQRAILRRYTYRHKKAVAQQAFRITKRRMSTSLPGCHSQCASGPTRCVRMFRERIRNDNVLREQGTQEFHRMCWFCPGKSCRSCRGQSRRGQDDLVEGGEWQTHEHKKHPSSTLLTCHVQPRKQDQYPPCFACRRTLTKYSRA